MVGVPGKKEQLPNAPLSLRSDPRHWQHLNVISETNYFAAGGSYRLLPRLTGCVSPRWHVQQVTFCSPTGKTPVPGNCVLICRTSRIILRAISFRGLRSHS